MGFFSTSLIEKAEKIVKLNEKIFNKSIAKAKRAEPEKKNEIILELVTELKNNGRALKELLRKRDLRQKQSGDENEAARYAEVIKHLYKELGEMIEEATGLIKQ